MFEIEEFRQWLIDRFEPEELLMFINVTTEDLLDAFPDAWEDNPTLIEMYGVGDIDGDDDD